MNSGPILMVSFYYPPYPKVGSRRWVKFAKYLHRHNRNIYVLAAQMDVDTKSPWDKDALEIENLTTRLHFKYKLPYFKKTNPTSLFSKIKWHLSKWSYHVKNSKPVFGNPADNTEIYATSFLKSARTIIEKNKISTVIFTASPNHLAFHISTLKKEYKNIKFIFDLRDYWSDWMKHLNNDQYIYELNLEKETIQNADLIFSPASRIIDTLKLRYPEKTNSLKVLPHAFDGDDFEVLADTNVDIKDPEIINLVYAGTMYDNMEENMQLLSKLLNSNSKVILTFYTFTDDYKAFFTNEILSKRVNYLPPLPIKEFTLKMQAEAHGMLYMRSTLNNDNNFLSSKFFDFLPLRKPIIYLGNKGDALDFIVTEKIGFHLDHISIPHLEKRMQETNKTIHELNMNNYSFETVTRQLEKEIEN